MGDARLATLLFTVTECDSNTVSFDLTQPFTSEASFSGSPYATSLLDSSAVIGDVTAPVLAGTPSDITQSADAGSCTQAVVSWTDPTATDNCDPWIVPGNMFFPNQTLLGKNRLPPLFPRYRGRGGLGARVKHRSIFGCSPSSSSPFSPPRPKPFTN
jgi:hypothetical protein